MHKDIHANEEKINHLTETLKANKDKVIAAYKNALIKEYENIIDPPNENDINTCLYDQRMQNWYLENRTVRAVYVTGTRANALSFDKEPSHYVTDDSEYNNEANCTINENNIVTLIGFHGDNETLNTISSLRFDGDNSFTITGTNTTFSITQGINDWFETLCDPCTQVTYDGETKGGRRYVNLLEIMAETSTEWNDLISNKDNFRTIAEFFFNRCLLGHRGNDWNEYYFKDEESFSHFPIDAIIPDLTEENVNSSIELIPSWTYEESENQ